MEKITKLSPAKINLTLDVKPKVLGADFHELETIYHLLDWGDELTVEPSDQFELQGQFDCVLEDNLIYRAWGWISQHTPPSLPSKGRRIPDVKVTVQKRIPTGSGLGGGSSNAATFVLAYYQLFGLGAVPEDLVNALADLGKDIPFFLSGAKCALGRHYGEKIKPLDFNFSGTPVYLNLPEFKHPTAWAYAQLKNFNTQHTQNLLKSQELRDCGNAFDQLFYTKKYAAFRSPQGGELEGRWPKIHLCGSGSAFFSREPLKITSCKMFKTSLN